MASHPISSHSGTAGDGARRLRKGAHAVTSTRRRILLVDDQPDLLTMLAIFLENLGYEVATACDGAEALASVRKRMPDLLITDQAMPRMTGLELCAELKSRPETRGIPIIVHSAQSMPRRSADGLYDYAIRKPASLSALMHEVRILLAEAH
jgi:two-component system phosphate regulon response regulator PhoB